MSERVKVSTYVVLGRERWETKKVGEYVFSQPRKIEAK